MTGSVKVERSPTEQEVRTGTWETAVDILSWAPAGCVGWADAVYTTPVSKMEN